MSNYIYKAKGNKSITIEADENLGLIITQSNNGVSSTKSIDTATVFGGSGGSTTIINSGSSSDLKIKVGYFGGSSLVAGSEDPNTRNITEIQSDLGCTIDLRHNYSRIVNFDTPANALSWFNANIKPTLNLGKEFLLTLMPNDVGSGSGQGADNLAAIEAGIGNTGSLTGNQYNDCLVNLYNVAKSNAQEGLIINFMHEANGQSGIKSWNAWNTGNLVGGQPAIATYVSAYKKAIALADTMSARPIVKFVQTLTRQNHNNANIDNSTATGTGNNLKLSVIHYYVDTIDFVGFNLHNKFSIAQESWISFQSWLAEYYNLFKRYGKPMFIAEMGCFPSNLMDKPVATGATGHVVNDILTFSQSSNVNAIPSKIKIDQIDGSGNPVKYTVNDPGAYFDPMQTVQITTSGSGTLGGISPRFLRGNRVEYFDRGFKNILKRFPLVKYAVLFIQDKVEANIPSRWNFQSVSERKAIGNIINQARVGALKSTSLKKVTNLLPDWTTNSNWQLTNTTIGNNSNELPADYSASTVPSTTFSVLGNGGTPQNQSAFLVVSNANFKQGKNYILQGLFKFIPTNQDNSDNVTIELTVQQNGGTDPVTGSNMFGKFLVHPMVVERSWNLIQQPINYETVSRSTSAQYRMIFQFGHNQVPGRIELRDFKLFESDEPEDLVE